MNRVNLVATGAAVAITVAIVNSLCAAAVVLWPSASVRLANTWAHGLDLQPIKAASPLTLGTFLYGLVALAAISFAVGVLFAWTYNAIAARRAGG